ncbi:MAG: T9SS type A sorting domain-containing protein, partial [Bacteroidales bacterium]|nr:T9SS type A sorting domain-containing protein [Bacteroidales bacterium]
ISGTDFVGGICGLNNPSGGVSFIKNCYSMAEVETRNNSTYYGGFCGYSTNDTAIINCYVTDKWKLTDSAESGLFSLRGNVRNETFMISSEFVDTLNNGLSVAAWQAHCGGEGAPSLLWECKATAISEQAEIRSGSLQVYPNPTFDKITVDGAAGEITVYDLSGRILTNVNVPANGRGYRRISIDISTLPEGQYIVRDRANAVKIIKR